MFERLVKVIECQRVHINMSNEIIMDSSIWIVLIKYFYGVSPLDLFIYKRLMLHFYIILTPIKTSYYQCFNKNSVWVLTLNVWVI